MSRRSSKAAETKRSCTHAKATGLGSSKEELPGWSAHPEFLRTRSATSGGVSRTSYVMRGLAHSPAIEGTTSARREPPRAVRVGEQRPAFVTHTFILVDAV